MTKSPKHVAPVAQSVAVAAPAVEPAPNPVRVKGLAPPPRKRTCAEFLEEWQRIAREIEQDIELDFSFRDDAITITDMRIPSALRTGVLYTSREVAEGADRVAGDFARRVDRFMAQAIKGGH